MQLAALLRGATREGGGVVAHPFSYHLRLLSTPYDSRLWIRSAASETKLVDICWVGFSVVFRVDAVSMRHAALDALFVLRIIHPD